MLTFAQQKSSLVCESWVEFYKSIHQYQVVFAHIMNWGCKLPWPEPQQKSLGTRPWSWEAEAGDQLDHSSFRLQQHGSQLTAEQRWEWAQFFPDFMREGKKNQQESQRESQRESGSDRLLKMAAPMGMFNWNRISCFQECRVIMCMWSVSYHDQLDPPLIA